MGGKEPWSLAKLSSSLTSALPTEKIVPKVSLLDECLKPTVPATVFGKHATGKASTRSSSLRRASSDGGGILNGSLGVRNACIVNTSSFGGRCVDSRLVIFGRLREDELDEFEISEFAGLASRTKASGRGTGSIFCCLAWLGFAAL